MLLGMLQQVLQPSCWKRPRTRGSPRKPRAGAWLRPRCRPRGTSPAHRSSPREPSHCPASSPTQIITQINPGQKGKSQIQVKRNKMINPADSSHCIFCCKISWRSTPMRLTTSIESSDFSGERSKTKTRPSKHVVAPVGVSPCGVRK